MRTSEMIAMLEENPRLKFRRTDRTGSDYVTVYDDFLCLFIPGEDIGQPNPAHIYILDDWQLVREPVPVTKAFEAWMEGKVIRCETDNCNGSGKQSYCEWSPEYKFTMEKECAKHGRFYIKEGSGCQTE